MKRERNALILIILAVAVIFFMSTGSACAGNGTRMLGFSSRDSGMAGATTASAEDTSCLIRNPASLVRIGNRVDVEYENIIPHHVSMQTEGATVAPYPVSVSNVGKVQKSTADYLPGGNTAISYRIPGTDKYPISVGCGAFTMAGVATSYPSSRLNEALSAMGTGVYDRMVDLRSLRIAPGIAVAFNDNLSFGATSNISVQALKGDLGYGDAGGTFREPAGAGKWDFVAGGGFTLGLLYKFNDMLSLGTSFESPTWMGHHYKYKNILPYIDEPPVVNAGVSIKPFKHLECTFDTRYINWTNVKLARLAPTEGGFGWRDQWVFATGLEYSAFCDKLKLRAGYNYGASPVRPSVVFANALLPIIVEHHFTTGFSYYITKDLSLDLVWEHHFLNSMTDNGCGDFYSRTGVGTKITASGEVIGVGFGYKFN